MDFPVLPKEVETINRQLVEHFGVDTLTGKPIWRVSWSNDQYEKRLTEYSDSGILLLFPEVRELPKCQWLKSRWILERLVLIPDINSHELPTQKQSYECMWSFEDRNGEALRPSFEASKFVVDTVYAALGKKSLAKYKDPDSNAEDALENRIKRIDKLEEELFGNESGLNLKTIIGEAIVVPQSYKTTLDKDKES